MKSWLYGLITGLGILGAIATAGVELHGVTLRGCPPFENSRPCVPRGETRLQGRVFTSDGRPAGNTAFVALSSRFLPYGWSVRSSRHKTDPQGRLCLVIPSPYLSARIRLENLKASAPVDPRFRDRERLTALLEHSATYKHRQPGDPFVLTSPTTSFALQLEDGTQLGEMWVSASDATSQCTTLDIDTTWYGYTDRRRNWRFWMPLLLAAIGVGLTVRRRPLARLFCGILGVGAFVASLLVYALA
jgi:hypothetical protein